MIKSAKLDRQYRMHVCYVCMLLKNRRVRISVRSYAKFIAHRCRVIQIVSFLLNESENLLRNREKRASRTRACMCNN